MTINTELMSFMEDDHTTIFLLHRFVVTPRHCTYDFYSSNLISMLFGINCVDTYVVMSSSVFNNCHVVY
jgi:hypothetical protein